MYNNMKQKVVYGVVFIVLISIGIFVFVYENKKEQSIDIVGSDLPLAEVDMSDVEIPVSDDLFSRPSTPEELVEKEESLGEGEVDLETQISKSWFDLRNKDNSSKYMEELVEGVRKSLESGILPQVAINFPLNFYETEQVGFQRAFVSYNSGNNAEIFNIVGPSSLEDNRAFSFFRVGVSLVDLGYVPFIYQYYGESNGILLISGYRPDNNNIILLVIDPISMRKIEMDLQLPFGNVIYGEGFIEIENPDDLIYLYEEYENEGMKDMNLYLVNSISEEETESYRFVVGSNSITLEKE